MLENTRGSRSPPWARDSTETTENPCFLNHLDRRLGARARARARVANPRTYQSTLGRARHNRRTASSLARAERSSQPTDRRRDPSLTVDRRATLDAAATQCNTRRDFRLVFFFFFFFSTTRVKPAPRRIPPGTWPPDVFQQKGDGTLATTHNTFTRDTTLPRSLSIFLSLSLSVSRRAARGFTPSQPNRRSCLSCKGHVYAELRSCKQDVRRRGARALEWRRLRYARL